VCEPTTIGAVFSGMGQIAGHQAENQAIAGRNRAKLRNFEEQNRLYDREVMFDRAQYRNDITITDIAQDDVYKALVGQWTEADMKLDNLFAESDFKLEEAVREMYKNEYAGTQTGATAARLAGASAKELGQKKSKILHDLMSGQEETIIAKEQATSKAKSDQWELHEKIAFAPIHGPTPMAPELEPKKSSASLILGLGSTIAGAWDA
tara:strand:+ start:29 stop:649 length:621 start_codon:yes stop_codon:yes gene_type:complete